MKGLKKANILFMSVHRNRCEKMNIEYDEIAIITAGDGVGVGKVFHYIEGKYALHQRAYTNSYKYSRCITEVLFSLYENGILTIYTENYVSRLGGIYSKTDAKSISCSGTDIGGTEEAC